MDTKTTDYKEDRLHLEMDTERKEYKEDRLHLEVDTKGQNTKRTNYTWKWTRRR